ncbi:Mucin-associated surface protein (MASP), subgroup S135 [Trypanosoma cruzi]|nr:Mucin-associated surface protein (MASP), subgroup S135 [Trypanosoma cruzi]
MAMMMTGRVLLVCALCVLWCGAAVAVPAADVSVGGDGSAGEYLLLQWRTRLRTECAEKVGRRTGGRANASAVEECVRRVMESLHAVVDGRSRWKRQLSAVAAAAAAAPVSPPAAPAAPAEGGGKENPNTGKGDKKKINVLLPLEKKNETLAASGKASTDKPTAVASEQTSLNPAPAIVPPTRETSDQGKHNGEKRKEEEEEEEENDGESENEEEDAEDTEEEEEEKEEVDGEGDKEEKEGDEGGEKDGTDGVEEEEKEDTEEEDEDEAEEVEEEEEGGEKDDSEEEEENHKEEDEQEDAEEGEKAEEREEDEKKNKKNNEAREEEDEEEKEEREEDKEEESEKNTKKEEDEEDEEKVDDDALEGMPAGGQEKRNSTSGPEGAPNKTNTEGTQTPGDSDASTAVFHTTSPLLLLVVACAAAAAVVAA